MSTAAAELTRADRETVFRRATSPLQKYEGYSLSDMEIATVLAETLGIFGGSCARGHLSVCYQAAGLKIWGGWHIVNHVMEKPLFTGKSTITMARKVYHIADPEDMQGNFFDVL